MSLQSNGIMTTVLAIYDQTLRDLTTTLEPVPDTDWALPMGGIVTHPAWTISHLCGSAELIRTLLNTESTSPKLRFLPAFGPGSQPNPNRSAYLTKPALMAALRELHADAAESVRSIDEVVLNRQPPAPFTAFAPTIGAIVVYLLAAHESYHLSLMVMWHRRWSESNPT